MAETFAWRPPVSRMLQLVSRAEAKNILNRSINGSTHVSHSVRLTCYNAKSTILGETKQNKTEKTVCFIITP